MIDADQLLDCIRKGTNAVVISHEKEATKRLFSAVRGYMDNMEVKPSTSIDSANEIKFPKRGSSYYIGTAGQKAFGRGDTVDRAHLSEADFYDDLERILNGIGEATEYGQIDIETTPNGRREVYDLWQKAKAGLSSFTPIFIPWFIDQDYSVDNFTEKERQGLSASVREMIDMPDEEFIKTLTEEEKAFRVRAEKEWECEGVKITLGMIKWRRYKIWDKGAMFFQEYPEDDVSCFLQSGRTVFSQILTLPNRRIPLDSLEKWGTDKDRYELKQRMLYAGIDCAEGTLTGDAHVFSVIDIEVGTGKAHVIFEMHSNEPIDIFDTKVAKVVKDSGCKFMIGVEKNGLGIAHINKLRALNIQVHEWVTSGTNRPVMISDIEEAYRKQELIETYPEAENEARDMEYDSTNKADHKKGKHDDRVFSRAIAWQMRMVPIPGITFI